MNERCNSSEIHRILDRITRIGDVRNERRGMELWKLEGLESEGKSEETERSVVRWKMFSYYVYQDAMKPEAI
jgi:hypothetical protein